MTEFAIDVATPLGFTVRCTRAYWDHVILEKHPALRGREGEVREALADPEGLSRSSIDRAAKAVTVSQGRLWHLVDVDAIVEEMAAMPEKQVLP